MTPTAQPTTTKTQVAKKGGEGGGGQGGEGGMEAGAAIHHTGWARQFQQIPLAAQLGGTQPGQK